MLQVILQVLVFDISFAIPHVVEHNRSENLSWLFPSLAYQQKTFQKFLKIPSTHGTLKMHRWVNGSP